MLSLNINNYYLPDKMKYTTSWLNTALYNTQIEESVINDNFTEQKHQTYIRNYLNINSIYNRILLFHGIGSGKTLTSISAAFSLEKYQHTFIITPASLQDNFKEEINKFNLKYKNNMNEFYKNYTFVKYNSSDIKNIYDKYVYNYYIGDYINFIFDNKNYEGIIKDVEGTFTEDIYNVNKYKINISLNENEEDEIIEVKKSDIKILKNNNKNVFDNKTIIIDEIHNLISMYKKDDIINYSSDVVMYRNKTLTDMIESENSKIILLSGTPVVNNIIELKYILNILHGLDIFIQFKINIMEDKVVDIIKLKENIMNNNKYINAVDVKQEKSVIYIDILKLRNNLRREGDYVVKTEYIYSVDNLISDMKENMILYFADMDVEYNLLDISPIKKRKLVEMSDMEFEQMFVENKITDIGEVELKNLKNIEYLKTLLIGKISYVKQEQSTKQIEHNLYLPMEADQLTMYNIIREKEITIGLKKKRGMDDTSKLRGASRQVCLIGIKNIDLDDEKKDKNKLINAFLKKVSIKNKKKMSMLIKNYSIKYYTLIDILDNNKNEHYLNNKVIIYSEYREFGVKLISLLLDLYGYSSIISYFKDIHKYFEGERLSEEGKKRIKENLKNINNKGKVYGVYNASTDARHIRENKFMKYIYDLEENDYGQYFRILFITKSGSEGLSFKSVRQVHIIDPYWNKTRTRQVMGRAVRYGSHDRLPNNMRNVHVYNYMTSFPKNIVLSDNIKKYDSGLTTDEYILKSSIEKQRIIDKLYNIFKTVSVDCPYNLDEDNMKCINYPLNSGEDDRIYNPFNLSINKQEEVVKRAKLIDVDGVKYICYNNVMYNYDIYKRNGSYIEMGVYEQEGEKLIFRVRDREEISIKMDVNVFNSYGNYGNVKKENKIYIKNLSEGSILEIGKKKGIIKKLSEKYLVMEYSEVDMEKKYIYRDSLGKYILKE